MDKTEAELKAQLEALRKKLAETEGKEEETNDDDTTGEEEDGDQTAQEGGDEEGKDEEPDAQPSEEEAKIAALKKSMDALDAKLKEANKKNRELERKQEAERIDRLKKEGKEAEALKAELKQAKKELDEIRSENVSLKRDSVLDMALNGHDFRSERSRNMARRDLLDGLQQNEEGNWVAADGSDVVTFVQKYVADEENAFLLKPKTNRGSGTQTPAKDPAPKPAQTIFDMPQDKFIAKVRKQMGR